MGRRWLGGTVGGVRRGWSCHLAPPVGIDGVDHAPGEPSQNSLLMELKEVDERLVVSEYRHLVALVEV